jgi:hypothetical protein
MVDMTEVSMRADSRSALSLPLTTSAFTAGTGPANMTPQQPDGGMDTGRTSDARSPQDQSPGIPDRPKTRTVPGGGRTGSADHPETASVRARRTTQRPQVEPLPSDASETCLCGDSADFVVDTQWFSGRHSRDPVCRRHVTEVVAAIAERQARRDGR